MDYKPKDFLVEMFFHKRTEKVLYELVFNSDEWKRLDRGEITFREARQRFMRKAERYNVTFEMEALLNSWTKMLSTRTATVKLMRLFKKKGFRLYYLSNISYQGLSVLMKKDFWPLFDGGVASCEAGVAKPDEAIYNELIERYHLIPEQTIFIDDVKENAESAFLTGITGIQFLNVHNLCEMLFTYGVDIEA